MRFRGGAGRSAGRCSRGVTVTGGAAGPLARVGAGRRWAGQPLAGHGAVETEAAAAGVVGLGEVLLVADGDPAPGPRAARGGGCSQRASVGEAGVGGWGGRLLRGTLRRSGEGCSSYPGTAGSTLLATGVALDRARAGSGGPGTARGRSADGRGQAESVVEGGGDPSPSHPHLGGLLLVSPCAPPPPTLPSHPGGRLTRQRHRRQGSEGWGKSAPLGYTLSQQRHSLGEGGAMGRGEAPLPPGHAALPALKAYRWGQAIPRHHPPTRPPHHCSCSGNRDQATDGHRRP